MPVTSIVTNIITYLGSHFIVFEVITAIILRSASTTHFSRLYTADIYFFLSSILILIMKIIPNNFLNVCKNLISVYCKIFSKQCIFY